MIVNIKILYIVFLSHYSEYSCHKQWSTTTKSYSAQGNYVQQGLFQTY